MRKHVSAVMCFAGVLGVAALAGALGHSAGAADKKDAKALCHVVLFEMADSAPADAVKTMIADGHALLAKVPSVKEMHTGRPADESKVANEKGYALALYAKFADSKGLSEYIDHPLHQQYVEKHKKNWAKVRVIDFWSE